VTLCCAALLLFLLLVPLLILLLLCLLLHCCCFCSCFCCWCCCCGSTVAARLLLHCCCFCSYFCCYFCSYFCCWCCLLLLLFFAAGAVLCCYFWCCCRCLLLLQKLLLLLFAAATAVVCFTTAAIGKEIMRGKRPDKMETRGSEEESQVKGFFRFSFIILVHKGVERRREEGKEKATRLEGKRIFIIIHHFILSQVHNHASYRLQVTTTTQLPTTQSNNYPLPPLTHNWNTCRYKRKYK